MAPPLTGIKVIEFAGLAPGPFVGMVLADFGADVVRVDVPPSEGNAGKINLDTLARHKRSVAFSPKTRHGLEVLKRLIAQADVLIDPFRPGVMERLGLGPDLFLDANTGLNKGLIYARLTGFQREGPYSNMAGHDINYLALSGVLNQLGTRHWKPTSTQEGKSIWDAENPSPSPPSFLMGDFAGGAMMCLLGILMALIARPDQSQSQGGQAVEADMVSGVRYLSTFLLQTSHSFANIPSRGGAVFGDPSDPTGTGRGTGYLEGMAPWYTTYRTQDGWISIGCLEPQFFSTFLRLMAQAEPELAKQHAGPALDPQGQLDRTCWPHLRAYIAEAFARRTRAQWNEVFLGTDACVVPILTRDEANGVRNLPGSKDSTHHGVLPAVPQESQAQLKQEDQPVPPCTAPHLSRTPALVVPGSTQAWNQEDDQNPQLLLAAGQDTEEVVHEWLGLDSAQLENLTPSKSNL